MDDSLYIRVIKFALEQTEGFTANTIINSVELNLNAWQKGFINRHFQYARDRFQGGTNTLGETMFSFVIGKSLDHLSDENKYVLTLEAEFAYLDYQELVFARENAKEAKRLSLMALILSGLAIVVSVVTPLWVANKFTQTIRVEGNQLETIKESFKEIIQKR